MYRELFHGVFFAVNKERTFRARLLLPNQQLPLSFICEVLLIQINDEHQFTPQLEPLPFREWVSEDTTMDKDRVVGSAKQIKGTVKQMVGKTVGDAKLEA
jgi:hypothetical protein